jgi:hypothetical protein
MFKFIVLDPVCNIPPDSLTDPKDGFPKSDFFVMSGFTNAKYHAALKRDKFSDLEAVAPQGYVVMPPAELGYNGVRWNGRFGLKLSSEEAKPVNNNQDITAYISKAISQVRPYIPDVEPRHKSLTVLVCGSMCGGTGSGVMLDLGYLLRRIILNQGLSPNLLGIFGLPDILSDWVAADSLWANAYAFLRELNWYMVEPDPKAAQSGLRRFFYKAKFGEYNIDESKPRETDYYPYDLGLFLSKQSEEGSNIDKSDKVLDMTAETLFLLTAGSAGIQYISNTLTILKNRYKVNRAKEVRPIVFGGLGSYSMRFPAHEVKNYLAALAAPSILGDYIISPQGASGKGNSRYQDLLGSDDPPFRLDKVEKYTRKERKPTALNFTDAVNDMIRPGRFDSEDLSELEPLKAFLEDVKKQAMAETKEKNKPHVQNLLQKLGDRVLAKIDEEYQKIFEDKGNLVALGEAAVFLGDIKQYCVERTGWGQVGKEEETPVQMTSKAREIKRQIESKYLDVNSPDLQAIAKAEGGSIFNKTKAFRAGLQTAVDGIIQMCFDAAMYEALDEFYRRVLGHADGLKLPIRFVQEDVAAELRNRMVKGALDELFTGKARTGVGLVNYVCADEKSVEAIIKPKVKLFQSDENIRRKEQDGILQELIPRIRSLVEEIRKFLDDWKGDPGGLLQNNRERFLGELRRHVDETIGRRIYEDLEANASIADVLLALGEKQKGLSRDKAVREVVSALVSGFEGNIQVFSGFNREAAEGAEPVEQKHLRINLERFNKSLGRYKGGNYSVENDPMFVGKGFQMEKELKDVFTFDVMIIRVGRPLFTLPSLPKCHGEYDEFRKGHVLHTDARFDEDSIGNFDYKLPYVETIGDEDDDVIFLFLLAEQDWWKNLGIFEHQIKIYKGDLSPLIARSGRNQSKYEISAPSGTVNATGREYAQTTFKLNPKGIQDSIKDLLKPRWNTGYTVQDRLKLLGDLMDKKSKDRDQTKWNELRRCYENERRILKALIDSRNVDL